MQVMHDRVLLKKIDPETKTAGGLVLTSAVNPVYEAEVIAVGPGKPVKDGTPTPLTVKVGDRVMYNPSATISVNVKGEGLLVVKEEEIYAILEKE
jgi:chaperonin GroES